MKYVILFRSYLDVKVQNMRECSLFLAEKHDFRLKRDIYLFYFMCSLIAECVDAFC